MTERCYIVKKSEQDGAASYLVGRRLAGLSAMRCVVPSSADSCQCREDGSVSEQGHRDSNGEVVSVSERMLIDRNRASHQTAILVSVVRCLIGFRCQEAVQGGRQFRPYNLGM
jgi:hypothetical protein